MSDECVCRSLCLVCSLFVSRSLYFFACSHCLFIPLNVPFGNLTVKWSNNRRGSTSDAKCTRGLIAQRFSIHPNVSHPQFSTFLQLLTVSSIDTKPSDEILSASQVRRNPHKYHFSESSSESTAPRDCAASSFLISWPRCIYFFSWLRTLASGEKRLTRFCNCCETDFTHSSCLV